MAKIGIIGGSGLYNIEGFEQRESVRIETPFGEPSDMMITGELGGQSIFFLPRHGRGHRLLPTEVNNRANIYAMKEMGVEWILSVSAVGSFKPELKPTHFCVIDQFVDRTNQARPNTFFGDGIVAHIQFAHPLCPELRKVIYQSGQAIAAPMHMGGTYVNMEGPAFSTLAESMLYKSWGMDVIGMTQMNEARLAREAEICYATLAMITDYDCWYEAETGMTVSVEAVLEVIQKNVENAKKLIKEAVVQVGNLKRECSCKNALQNAILTSRDSWPEKTLDHLGPIMEKYR